MLLRMIDGSTDTELREKVMGMFPKREWKAGSDARGRYRIKRSVGNVIRYVIRERHAVGG